MSMEDEIRELKIKTGGHTKVLEIKDWKTNASGYPEQKIGSAEIKHYKLGPGYYLMEGVKKCGFYHLQKAEIMTELLIRGETWMSDDPYNWNGLDALVSGFKGRVLCIGLGLGLVQHILAKKPEVTKVTTIEVNKDVVAMMASNMPTDQRIQFGDFWLFDEFDKFDCVVVDIWVSNENTPHGERKKIAMTMQAAIQLIEQQNPKAIVKLWGMIDPKYGLTR